jgi:hypothetical protein
VVEAGSHRLRPKGLHEGLSIRVATAVLVVTFFNIESSKIVTSTRMHMKKCTVRQTMEVNA